jgi:hypothetical protein
MYKKETTCPCSFLFSIGSSIMNRQVIRERKNTKRELNLSVEKLLIIPNKIHVLLVELSLILGSKNCRNFLR